MSHNPRHPRNQPHRGSTIENYGVWVATIKDYWVQPETTGSRAPHIYLNLDDGSDKTPECAINIKSIDKVSPNLVSWFIDDFQHPLTQTLDGLEKGYQAASPDSGLGLDFVRTSPPLIDINQGKELEAEDGMANDIVDRLKPIIQRAQDQGATLFIFGSKYPKPGIHDIHMNQGSVGFENSKYTDGCVIIKFSDHYEAVFLGFASQYLPTDDKGLPIEGRSDTLHNIVKNQEWPIGSTDGDNGTDGGDGQ